MIIDYFVVLFSTLDLLHCHYFNKIMQLEKGVFSCWVLQHVTILLFLVNGSPEKGCFCLFWAIFPFTAMLYHRNEGYIVASFLAKPYSLLEV